MAQARATQLTLFFLPCRFSDRRPCSKASFGSDPRSPWRQVKRHLVKALTSPPSEDAPLPPARKLQGWQRLGWAAHHLRGHGTRGALPMSDT